MPRVALEASTDDLADFIDAQTMSAATRYTYIADLRAFYGWAKSQGHIGVDPLGWPELRAAPETNQARSVR
jgi:hypothetical protein